MHVSRSNTILYCSQWADTVAFYRDTIGLDSSFENDWFVEFDLHADAHLSVADAAHATVGAGDGSGITLSWQVDDLEAASRRLESLGVTVSAPITRWGGLTVFFHDPSGNRIEFWSPAG